MWPSSNSPAWRIDIANAILFLKHIRTVRSPPPVILVSGSLLTEAKEEALANGAFAYIPKPVDLAEFDRFVLLAIESRLLPPPRSWVLGRSGRWEGEGLYVLRLSRTKLLFIFDTDATPACRIINSNSRLRISRTRSTPAWPNAARPHR
jgi:CheY-like chemotaxis protein